MLVFIDETADGAIRMNSEVCRATILALNQPDAAEIIGGHFTERMNNGPKHTAEATQELLKANTYSRVTK